MQTDNNQTAENVNVQFLNDGKILARYPKDAPQTVYTVPEGVIHIAEGAFESCRNLEKVVISQGVQFIGKSAFRGCSSLKEVVLPNSLIGIKIYAFAGCYALKDLQLPASLSWAEARAFYGCGCVRSSGNSRYVGPYLVETFRSDTYDAPHGEYKTYETVTYYSIGSPPENRKLENSYLSETRDYWGNTI